ncbi:hypothetical protein DIPPA_24995 [Diplonema papillatum]|nr:hypothetical protein DIPPA_24995 [Diplonema papillatum]
MEFAEEKEPTTKLPFVTRFPASLRQFKSDGNLFIRAVEKTTSRGTQQDRVLVVTYEKLLCCTTNAGVRRYQSLRKLSRVTWQRCSYKKQACVRVLFKIPLEKDLLLMFVPDALYDTEQNETNVHQLMTILQKVRKSHDAHPNRQNVKWEGCHHEEGTNFMQVAQLKDHPNSEFQSPLKTIAKYQKMPAGLRESMSSKRSSSWGYSMTDFNSPMARTQSDTSAAARQQKQDYAELEKNFKQLKNMNTWMDDQIKQRNAEAEDLKARIFELEKQGTLPTRDPSVTSPTGQGGRLRRVSFNESQQQEPASWSETGDKRGKDSGIAALQDELAVLSNTVDELQREKQSDEKRISELTALVDGLLREKGSVMEENLTLQSVVASLKRNQSTGGSGRRASSNAGVQVDVAYQNQNGAPREPGSDQWRQFECGDEFEATLKDIGWSDEEVQQLRSLSIRKREHLSFVTFSELRSASLPVACIRRLLNAFNYREGAAPDDLLIPYDYSSGRKLSAVPPPVVADSLLRLQMVCSRISLSRC